MPRSGHVAAAEIMGQKKFFYFPFPKKTGLSSNGESPVFIFLISWINLTVDLF